MEKFYTVEDIAKMAMFTERTIRKHLKEGVLKGRKIGGQWRFTEDDIINYTNQGSVGEMMKSEKEQDVLDFLAGVYTEYTDEVQTCAVIDVYRDVGSVVILRDGLMQLINSGENRFMRFSFDYNKKEGKARFILFGPSDYISEAMKIVSN